MKTAEDNPLGHLIRARRKQLGMSQYDLARALATVSGQSSMERDRVARWERGQQVPRREWRQWLAIVLRLSTSKLGVDAWSYRDDHRPDRTATRIVAQNPRLIGATKHGSLLLPIFRPEPQASVLAATFLNPHRECSLGEIVRGAHFSRASITKEIDRLQRAGLIDTCSQGGERVIRSVTDASIREPLTQLLRASYGLPHIISEQFASVRGVKRVTVAGDWVARLMGLPSHQPETIVLRVVADGSLNADQVMAAINRIEEKTHYAVGYELVTTRKPATSTVCIPRPCHDGLAVEIETNNPIHKGGAASPSEGAQLVHALLQARQLERLTTPDVSSAFHFAESDRLLNAAERLAGDASASGFLLICHAARLIGLALLARHRLQPAPRAHPMVVSRVIIAQFGEEFTHIEKLQRRLRELNTPVSGDNRATMRDIDDYLPTVRRMLANSRRIGL